LGGFVGPTLALPVPSGGVCVGGVLGLGLFSDFTSAEGGEGGLETLSGRIVDVIEGLDGVIIGGDEGKSLLSGFVVAESDGMVSSGFLVSAKYLCYN
jgi:hypothetical protein